MVMKLHKNWGHRAPLEICMIILRKLAEVLFYLCLSTFACRYSVSNAV